VSAPSPDPESGGPTSSNRPGRRPPFLGRLSYLIGGTMPTEFRLWVEHDLTGAGWRNRQAIRLVLQTLPFAVIFLLLPGRINVRVSIAVFLLLVGVGMGYATSTYFRNRRLVQHGLPIPVPREEDEDEDDDL
jgi:hypothetical protein